MASTLLVVTSLEDIENLTWNTSVFGNRHNLRAINDFAALPTTSYEETRSAYEVYRRHCANEKVPLTDSEVDEILMDHSEGPLVKSKTSSAVCMEFKQLRNRILELAKTSYTIHSSEILRHLTHEILIELIKGNVTGVRSLIRNVSGGLYVDIMDDMLDEWFVSTKCSNIDELCEYLNRRINPM
jgi:hypothetical protein